MAWIICWKEDRALVLRCPEKVAAEVLANKSLIEFFMWEMGLVSAARLGLVKANRSQSLTQTNAAHLQGLTLPPASAPSWDRGDTCSGGG